MKNIYTFEELSQKEKNKERCAFCAKTNTSAYWLRIRRIRDKRLMSMDYICDDCKVKFVNDELRKCGECERIYRWIDQVCKCAYLKSIGDDDENTDEEKKPSKSSQLEHQLHELSLKKEELEDELETEREAHLAGVDATASWYKREHRKELETLEEKRRRLSNENKKLKTKIAELEEALNKYQTKLENITTQTFDILDIPSQQEAFQEQPPKN